jgi:spermidine/putrescine-binding protein
MARIPFTWNSANFAYNTNPFPNQSANPFSWDDVALIIEVLEGFAGGKAPDDYFQLKWTKEKKQKFITLIMKCEANNIDYKETKEIKDRQIRISDIALVAKEVLGINIKIDL